MRKKSKRILKCIMTFILAVAMMTGAVPEMNMTVYASSYYTTYLVTSGDTDQTLPDKVVHFNNYDWYIIADNSTAVDAGTITMFAKDNIGNSKFNQSHYGNNYNGSTIKGYLDNLISSSFFEMSDAIVSVDLQDVGVTGAKLWLLSTSEVEKLNVIIRRCSSNWWLRSPSSSDSEKAFVVACNNGGVIASSGLPFVDLSLGVRPALKLDLSKVEFNKATQTFSAIGQTVSVANMNLEPSTPQTIAVGDTVSFTASISPDEATDKTVKWKIGGTHEGALTLYSDPDCKKPLGSDATEVLTVYAKGSSTGNAIVTCFSNSDSAKFASCEVAVNTLQTQIEGVLTTITATGAKQANFSTENVASLDLLKANFNEVNGWNGTDMTIEVTPCEGYTITRCVFYDDSYHIATDSVAPFKVETEHLASTPHVDGKPIYEGSNGIKKIDVIGYYTGNSVTITPGSNMTKTLDSGDALQNGLSGAMTAVVYTADDGYYFPTGYNVEDVNGISVTRDSYTQITVSGTPTADAVITLAEPTAKTKPDAPAVSAVNCTTAANNDGKLTGVTAAMEYKKSDATSWTAGTGNDITGLVPGTYYVRLKATDTTLVSDNQELVISAYTVPGQVVAPVFNPAAGTYTEAQSVTISCETTGADIYYTTNGSEPMTSSTKYEGSISVAETTTIKAIAIKDGMENSEVTAATYTISEAMPTKYAVTVNDGTGDGEYAENTTVAITANEAPSGKIFDSWASDDGVTFADANATTTTFTMPAKAVTVTANYRNVDTVAMPTFSPVGGTYSSAQSVTISCSTTGADIYYTTNGNEPTTSSTKYTGAISISATTTVKAIAVKSGMMNSAVASAVYTIKTSPVITKAPEAITGLVYNGKAQALITAGEVTGGTLYYAVVKAGDAEPSAELYTTSIPTAINAGTYYVWYMVKGDADHTDSAAECVDVTINARSITGAEVALSGMQFTYDGVDKGVTVKGVKLADGTELTANDYDVSGTTDASDIGTYTVTVTGKGNYSGTASAEWKIVKEADPALLPISVKTAPAARTLYYNGKAQALITAGEAEGGSFVYALGNATAATGEYSAAIPTGTAVGEYVVYYKLVPAAGRTGDVAGSIRVTISESSKTPVPVQDDSTDELHLVKGEKFTLPGTGWVSSDKKKVSITKKGVLTAKKVTDASPVEIKRGGQTIKVYVTQPVIAKKLTLEAGKESKVSFQYDAENLTVLWCSGAPDVATVDEDGNVTAIGKGSATITAYVRGKAYNCKLKVTESTAAEERTLHMTVGTKKTLSLKGVKFTEWTSDDTAIAATAKKKITAVAAGETDLRVTVGEKEYIVHLYVEDPAITSSEIKAAKGKNKYTLELKAGETVDIDYKYVDQQVLYKSSKPEIAYESGDGTIVAAKAGKTRLTARINGKTVTINVVVK